MKRSFDFHADVDNVLSKARNKYNSGYEIPEVSSGKHDDPSLWCYQWLMDYSEAAGELMKCVANSSRPLRVCTNCVQLANDVKHTHDILKNKTNHWKGKKKCIDALTHKDALEVVESVFETAIGEKR